MDLKFMERDRSTEVPIKKEPKIPILIYVAATVSILFSLQRVLYVDPV